MNENITLNDAQQQYVIRFADGISAHGYKNVMDNANQIAQLLKRGDLLFAPNDFGTLKGYEKYMQAIDAWARSPMSNRTYFEPGTAPKAAKVLERCRRDCRKVRLITGNPDTGKPWLNEYGVVGKVGRSIGPLKSSLLVEAGKDGGALILTHCLLAVYDWQTGKALYRHPLYRAPELMIRQHDDARLPWEVLHENEVVARFKSFGKASAYAAFMCGEMIEPRVFQ